MKSPFAMFSLAWIFSLLLSSGGLPAAQLEDEPFTSKFQTQPAEEDGPEASGGKSGPGGGGKQLSEEDRQRMKSIHDKLSENPEVQKAREEIQNAQTPEEHQEAMKKMRKVMDKAMSAEDRAFMEKMRKQQPKKKKQGGKRGPGGPGDGEGFQGGAGGEGGQGGQGGQGGRGRRGPQKEPGGQGEDGFPGVPPEFGGEQGGGQGQGPRKGGAEFGGEHGRSQLSEEQRTRLKSIRAKYKDDPEVKAAREAVKEAITPEERDLAIEEYKATVRTKLNSEDREYLDEIRKNRVQQRPTQVPQGGERF